MTLHRRAAVLLMVFTIGCLPRGPVVDTGAAPEGVGGTIAGTVSASDEKTPLAGRKITAIDATTSRRFDTSTGVGGSYSLKVPAGTYRLELELRPGEMLDARPEATDVGVGDIDSARNFVVTVASR
jgi:hypothetical protein